MATKKATKKAPYRSVSDRLGLERLAKSTPRTCRARANEIEHMIEKGKVPKSLLDTARQWIYKYRARARALAS